MKTAIAIDQTEKGHRYESTAPVNADAIRVTVDEKDPAGTQEEAKNLAEVFSSEKPRDALDGVSSGLGNVTRGVVGGLAMMMAAPIQGGMCLCIHVSLFLSRPLAHSRILTPRNSLQTS